MYTIPRRGSRVRLAIAVALLAATLVVSASPPAAAAPSNLCTFVGTLDVNPGVLATLPAGQVTGNYTFHDVLFVCVGAIFGDASLNSSGGLGYSCGAAPVLEDLGSFCGTWSAMGFESGAVNGNGDCTGQIGGPHLLFGGLPRWSFTAGPTALGYVNASCTSWSTPILPGRVVFAEGVVAAIAQPDPTTANILGGGPYGCSPPPPGLGPVIIYYCGLIIEGVMVLL